MTWSRWTLFSISSVLAVFISIVCSSGFSPGVFIRKRQVRLYWQLTCDLIRHTRFLIFHCEDTIIIWIMWYGSRPHLIYRVQNTRLENDPSNWNGASHQRVSQVRLHGATCMDICAYALDARVRKAKYSEIGITRCTGSIFAIDQLDNLSGTQKIRFR